jgi:hypothetical protein
MSINGKSGSTTYGPWEPYRYPDIGSRSATSTPAKCLWGRARQQFVSGISLSRHEFAAGAATRVVSPG